MKYSLWKSQTDISSEAKAHQRRTRRGTYKHLRQTVATQNSLFHVALAPDIGNVEWRAHSPVQKKENQCDGSLRSEATKSLPRGKELRDGVTWDQVKILVGNLVIEPL